MMDIDDSSSMPPSDHIFSSQEYPSSPAFPSSPPPPSSRSNKPKRPPTVTPRRFNRFFNPLSSRNRDSSPISSARALKALTGSAVNSRVSEGPFEFEDFPETRPNKRRKFIGLEQGELPSSQADYDSDALLAHSSPIRSLPNKEAVTRLPYTQGIRDVLNWEPSPYRRARQPQVVADYRYTTATFCSQPEDIHSYATTAPHALPFCVASCNTNSLVALGDEEGHVRIVESAKDGKPDFSTSLLTFKPHHNAIMGVAFSSDDKWLVTASGDQTAKIIDMYAQKTVFTLAEHTSSVKQVVFQPGEDNMLATCSRDGVVAIWDLRCAQRTPTFTLSTLSDDMNALVVRVPKMNLLPNAHRPDLDLSRTSTAPSPSITSLSFLSASRSHLLLTSSDASARLRLWDIRARHTTTTRRPCPIPVATTTAPPSHEYTIRQTPYGPSVVSSSRPKGISSIAVNTDASRLYAICKDNTVYAYSTNHLILGQAPELAENCKKTWRQGKERDGMGPLYGLRHEELSVRSFYVKCAIRPATAEKEEVLAVGSSLGSPVLFSTDEKRYQASAACEGRRGGSVGAEDMLPIYQTGTALVRGHESEVTGVVWTKDGDMVSVGDDYTARVWREDETKARELRCGGEGEGKRWGCGWADVDGDWDEEDG